MESNIKYHIEIKTVPYRDRTIILENLTPILSPPERERRKKEIEKRLYEVFSKYAKTYVN